MFSQIEDLLGYFRGVRGRAGCKFPFHHDVLICFSTTAIQVQQQDEGIYDWILVLVLRTIWSSDRVIKFFRITKNCRKSHCFRITSCEKPLRSRTTSTSCTAGDCSVVIYNSPVGPPRPRRKILFLLVLGGIPQRGRSCSSSSSEESPFFPELRD